MNEHINHTNKVPPSLWEPNDITTLHFLTSPQHPPRLQTRGNKCSTQCNFEKICDTQGAADNAISRKIFFRFTLQHTFLQLHGFHFLLLINHRG